jgi:predicted  nucleic acid-binding Zn-ribbon protein
MPVETPERELDELKQQAQQLQSSLNQINNRIEQLQK